MLTALEILLSAHQQDAELPAVPGSWSGMIPTILELGFRDVGGDFDPIEMIELLSAGIIDATNAGDRPMLTKEGLAVYEYLTRL